jgi:nucleoside-diphosphate-sugar epimerase
MVDSSVTRILLTGATGEHIDLLPVVFRLSHQPQLNSAGYIGGSVLTRLLNHPNSKTFQIHAIVRSAEKAQKLNALGVHATVGPHSDLALLTAAAAQADVVFACVWISRFQV